MIKIFQYKNGEIRIKKDENLSVRDYQYEWKKRQIKVKTVELPLPFCLGVEIIVHTGGRICYRMLSAQVSPYNEPDCVNLSLAYTQNNTVRYTETGLIDDSHIYKGLPEEYTADILDRRVSFILEKEVFPQCSNCYKHAAHSAVASSPMIFGVIAETIINIICTGSVDEIFHLDAETFYIKNLRFLP